MADKKAALSERNSGNFFEWLNSSDCYGSYESVGSWSSRLVHLLHEIKCIWLYVVQREGNQLPCYFLLKYQHHCSLVITKWKSIYLFSCSFITCLLPITWSVFAYWCRKLNLSLKFLYSAFGNTCLMHLHVENLYNSMESVVSSAISEWETILCTSDSLSQVCAQVVPEPLLRWLILRTIFCALFFISFGLL